MARGDAPSPRKTRTARFRRRMSSSFKRPTRRASVGSVVNGQTVIEAVASKLSSCRMTTGRGLPALSAPPATARISPRLNHRPMRRRHPRRPDHHAHGHCWRRPWTAGAPRPEIPLPVRPGPRSGSDAIPGHADARDAPAPSPAAALSVMPWSGTPPQADGLHVTHRFRSARATSPPAAGRPAGRPPRPAAPPPPWRSARRRWPR